MQFECNLIPCHISMRIKYPSSHFMKRIIYAFLQRNTVLQELNVSYNNIGDEGAAYLAEALAANDYLKVIDLSWNKIRPFGIVQIAKAVQASVIYKCDP